MARTVAPYPLVRLRTSAGRPFRPPTRWGWSHGSVVQFVPHGTENSRVRIGRADRETSPPTSSPVGALRPRRSPLSGRPARVPWRLAAVPLAVAALVSVAVPAGAEPSAETTVVGTVRL